MGYTPKMVMELLIKLLYHPKKKLETLSICFTIEMSISNQFFQQTDELLISIPEGSVPQFQYSGQQNYEWKIF